MGKNNPVDRSLMRIKSAKVIRWIVISLVYLIVFSLLDLLSQRFQIYPGVVAWYPPDGLVFAFLLTFGSKFSPVVVLGSIISSMIIYKFNAPFVPIFVWAIVLTTVYAVTAIILRSRLHTYQHHNNIRNTVIWICVSALITSGLAMISVANLTTFGAVPQPHFFDATFQWWIGEMTGLLVFTPFLLIYVMPWVKKVSEGEKVALQFRLNRFKPQRETVAQVVAMLVVLIIVFGIRSVEKFQLQFLIAIPLIWVAVRHGFARASLANVLTNFGIMFAFWLFDNPVSDLGKFQFLMFGVFFSVLMIGAITSRQKEVDEELRRKEIYYRALIENAPDGIILLGEDRTLKYRSPSTERILGYSHLPNEGPNPVSLTHPDDAKQIHDVFEGVLRNPEKVAQAQYRVKHQNGSWRWVESTFTNQVNNPSLQAVVINFRDVTERKLAEDAVSQREQHFRALVEQSSEEISLLDAEGVLLYESPNAHRPLGYPINRFVGRKIFEIFHPDEKDEVIRVFMNIVKTPGMVTKVLFRAKALNGTWHWMEGTISNLLDVPAVKAIVLNYSDVTDRVEIERKIEELARIPDESPNPVMRMSMEGVLLYANSTSSGILKMWDINIGGKLPQYMVDIATVAFARHENIPVEITCDDKIFSVTVTPIIEMGYVNLYGRDITKRVRAEESLKVSNDELSMLFQLSHSLAEADSLGHIFDIVNRHAVESTQTTFARIAFLEDDNFVIKAGFPSGEINKGFKLGDLISVSTLPLSQRIMNENEIRVILSNDPELCEEERRILFINGAACICLIPLRTSYSSAESETLVGLLILADRNRQENKQLSPDKYRLLQTIGDSAAIAIRRMLLNEQTDKRMKQLVALSEIDLAIVSNTDMNSRLNVVNRQIMEQLRVDAVNIWVYDPQNDHLELTSSRGFKTTAFEKAKPVTLSEGVLGQAIFNRKIIHISNIAEHNKNPRLARALAKEPFIGYYAIPLVAKNEVKGVLEIFQRTELEGNQEWLNFLQILANQAAIAIDNSLLFNDLEQSNAELIQAYDATIQGWSRALDLRDNETEGHTQRVTELTMKLARMFGLPEEELVHIRRGALLHDIGKMGVPDRILLKPGTLTDEEWVIMRQHTSFAQELLSPIAFLKPALDIPMCHHEKWDGTGYPLGLAGDQIPFAARIFSVVDVWDALTSDRPYRAAWPEEKVVDYIRSLSGTQFDPQVVEVCLEPGFLSGKQKHHSVMEQLTWSEKFSVGDKEMDFQHQRIIAMINRLISVTSTTTIHSETASNLIDEMSQYAKIHFEAEERLIASAEFPGFDEHKLQHQQFQAKVNEYSASLSRGEKMKAEELLEFLKKWWQHHILVEDMTYKSFLEGKKLSS